MPDILIRDVPEDVANALSQMAQAAGKDRMAWIREQLSLLASGPVIHKRYAIKFYNSGDESGLIRRFGDELNATSATHGMVSREIGDVISKAADHVRRNQAGDKEEAMWLLKNVFDNVFEVPV
jgi:uncharacterized membrane protein YidH (DUF202 family)